MSGGIIKPPSNVTEAPKVKPAEDVQALFTFEFDPEELHKRYLAERDKVDIEQYLP
jgi:hypothetical protein